MRPISVRVLAVTVALTALASCRWVVNSARVVGGDGVVFDFHGENNRDFCLVSDSYYHINAHMIGRMYNSKLLTWINSLAISVGSTHVLLSTFSETRWDPFMDHIQVWVNGSQLNIPAPGHKSGPLAEPGVWESSFSDVRITRQRVNEARLEIRNFMDLSLVAASVDENLWTDADCFVHFEMEFKTIKISKSIHGILGQTYRPSRLKAAIVRAKHNNNNYNSADEAIIGKKGRPAIVGQSSDYLTSGPWATNCRFSKFENGQPSLKVVQNGQEGSGSASTSRKPLSSDSKGAAPVKEEVNPLEGYFSEKAEKVITSSGNSNNDNFESPDVFAEEDSELNLSEEEGTVVDVKSYNRLSTINDRDLVTIPSGLSLEALMNE